MNRIALIALAAAATAAVGSAAPITCAAPSPSSVASPGFSYTCGGLTFSNFNVVNAGNQPVGQVNIGNSSYEDIAGARYVTLNLNPNLTLPPGSSGSAAVHLWYTVSGLSALPHSSYAVSRIGGVMPQSGQYVETVCSASFGGGTSCSGTQLAQFTVAGASNAVQWGPTFADAFTAYVYKNITGPAPIHTTALAQVFRATGPLNSPAETTPEPASVMLIGTGLIATAIFGRRVAKK